MEFVHSFGHGYTLRNRSFNHPLAVLVGCDTDPSSDARPAEVELTAAPANTTVTGESVWFVERAADVGLDFVHFNGASGEFFYPELLPPGVGLFEYDNDGDLDVFVVQGHVLGAGKALGDALIAPSSPGPLTGRLYRNDLEIGSDGTSSSRFTDVTEKSGLTADGYGLGVATGDMDNDGWVDLFVTNF